MSLIVNRTQGTGGDGNANPPLEITFSLLNHSFESFGENIPHLDVNTNYFSGADAPAARSFCEAVDSGNTDNLIVHPLGRLLGNYLNDYFQAGQINPQKLHQGAIQPTTEGLSQKKRPSPAPEKNDSGFNDFPLLCHSKSNISMKMLAISSSKYLGDDVMHGSNYRSTITYNILNNTSNTLRWTEYP